MDLLVDQSQRRTAHQVVRDALRRAILTGKLPSGARLVQSELAEQLKVSTTPVREALRDLATEGLIQLDAHRGAVVRKLSHEEVYEIYSIRRLLEPEAIIRAVERMTEEELDTAEAIQERADAEEDPALWVELNQQFHRIFIEAAQAPRLAGILTNLQDSAAMYIAATLLSGEHRRQHANSQHRELIQAARARDSERAAKAMLAHIEQTVDTVSRIDVERPADGS